MPSLRAFSGFWLLWIERKKWKIEDYFTFRSTFLPPLNIKFCQKVHRGIKPYGETVLLFGETYTIWQKDTRLAKGESAYCI